jgi:D-3-phosphoglycerate dehydrogenase / 2-oxoglutarate reductase
MTEQYSFPREKIKILLLEGLHPAAKQSFQSEGYALVEMQKAAMSESELAEAISSVHVLGLRSKTVVTESVLAKAKNLLAIGCFCIGTDQVDLAAAARRGVCVFNAPFSNTRSVAELAMAEVVMLSRRGFERSTELHGGVWRKSAEGCYEVRNKTLGIVGYGHIGPQVGLLAEAFGMRVVFYDIATKLPLGNARQLKSLRELMEVSDFVTLHVPETPQTRNMISAKELRWMRKGGYLLNLSRGLVVDLPALKHALLSEQIAGAAVDVYPSEPQGNDAPFECGLCGLKNVILTPHVGGSTVEAQRNIGAEVANSLMCYLNTGATGGAVNFPNVELPLFNNSHRVLNIHKNVPGVLSEINKIVADMGVNISAQYLATTGEIGYLIMDVGKNISRAVKKKIDDLPTNIRTRLLF